MSNPAGACKPKSRTEYQPPRRMGWFVTFRHVAPIGESFNQHILCISCLAGDDKPKRARRPIGIAGLDRSVSSGIARALRWD
jgi:hypothetical protein